MSYLVGLGQSQNVFESRVDAPMMRRSQYALGDPMSDLLLMMPGAVQPGFAQGTGMQIKQPSLWEQVEPYAPYVLGGIAVAGLAWVALKR